MQIQRTVETTAAPDKVFAYLSDFTNTEEWDPGTVSTRRLAGDGGLGTTYHNVSSFRGRETELEYEVTDLQPEKHFALRGENKTLISVDDMAFEPAGTGTRVTYTATFTFKGVVKYVVPLMSGAFKKLGDDAEESLRGALAKL